MFSKELRDHIARENIANFPHARLKGPRVTAFVLLPPSQAFEASGGSFDDPEIPQDLRELVQNVKRAESGSTAPAKDTDFMDIVPEPFFVVKSVDDTGRKTFLNVLGSEHIPESGNWKGGVPENVKEALVKMDADAAEGGGEPSDVLRFPLSVGPLRRDLDAKDQPCFVIDCVFNLEVVRSAAGNRHLKQFLIDVVLGAAANKHKLQLDPKFRLPKYAQPP